CRVSGSGSEDSAMVSIERTGRSLRHTSVHVLAAALALFSVPASTVPTGPGTARAAPAASVIEILEDTPEPLLRELEGQGGGQGVVETIDVYSGRVAVKIAPMQRFRRNVPGWAYRVAEHPDPGECRYLRFAWRADGARGI